MNNFLVTSYLVAKAGAGKRGLTGTESSAPRILALVVVASMISIISQSAGG